MGTFIGFSASLTRILRILLICCALIPALCLSMLFDEDQYTLYIADVITKVQRHFSNDFLLLLSGHTCLEFHFPMRQTCMSFGSIMRFIFIFFCLSRSLRCRMGFEREIHFRRKKRYLSLLIWYFYAAELLFQVC